jgi:hypothetical protein
MNQQVISQQPRKEKAMERGTFFRLFNKTVE